MEVALLILLVLVLAVLGYLVWMQVNQKESGQGPDQERQQFLYEAIENLRKEILESGGKNRQEIQFKLDNITDRIFLHQQQTSDNLRKQFQHSSEVIKDVTEKITQIEETNKQVLGFAEQMKSLENILRNPKQRGIIGEFYLENLLSNVLPPSNFKMQYTFQSGETVDAVIFAKGKIIPIDAKFSLENYNRLMNENDKVTWERLEGVFKNDLKKRIDETSKYVKPEENTTEFAFMFIPADGIFYNLLVPK
ncbi:MAG: DNA recombination protein RmuC, partial [Bacteroidetes bacterium]|nr:DNA recombination protein RmuC [Bacteroidota bacterium]